MRRVAIPYLESKVCPKAEREDIEFLNHVLRSLDEYVNRFEDALKLFERSRRAWERLTNRMIERGRDKHPATKEAWAGFETARKHIRWSSVAARDAAMTLYHFGHALEAIKGATANCPSVCSLFDAPMLRAARKQYTAKFPSAKSIRHALAHSAENAKSLKLTQFHVGPSRHLIGFMAKASLLNGAYSGDGISVMFEGKNLDLQLSRDGLAALRDIQRSTYRALAPAVRVNRRARDKRAAALLRRLERARQSR